MFEYGAKDGFQKIYVYAIQYGFVLRNYCMSCNEFYDEEFILASKGITTCTKCGGRVKPDLVLYEECLDNDIITGAVRAISKADTLIIRGTSLVVYPAAEVIDYFRGLTFFIISTTICLPKFMF